MTTDRPGILVFLLVVISLFSWVNPGVINARDTQPVKARSTGSPLVLRQADSIRMNQSEGILTAEGDVVVEFRGYRLRSDTISYDRSTRMLEAGGNVHVETAEAGGFIGKYFRMRLSTNELTGRSVDARHKPWFIKGKRMEGDADTMVHVPSGQFTTCDLETPHYTFRTSDLYLYPGRSIIGYHTTLNVGGLPVLYLPYFYVDLRNFLGRWEIKPGYGSLDGASLELNYHYLLRSDTGPYTATILTDMREHGGAGAGFDVGYNAPAQDASLYFFGANRRPTEINEQGESVRSDTEFFIWRTRSDVNYRIDGSKWKIHANADWSEENRFNRDFQGTLGGRARPRRSYEGSLVRSGKDSTFRLDVIREEKTVQRDSDVVFEQEQSVLPRIQYQLYSRPVPVLGKGVYYSMTSRAEHSARRDTGDELWDLTLNQSLTRSFVLTRSLGQSYRFGYEHSYLEQPLESPDDYRHQSVGSFDLLNSYRLTGWSTLSLDYSLAKQFNRQNQVAFTLQGDSLGISQNGLRTHQLELGLQWRQRGFSGSIRTGYDFRRSRSETVRGDSRVFSPLFSMQADLTPRLSFDQYLRYSWTDRYIQQASTEFDLDVSRNFNVSLGGNYNRRTPTDVLKLKNRFRWTSPSDRWGLRGDIVYDNPRSELEETNLMLYRRLHKWEMRLFFREIEDRGRQVWVSFNLLSYPSKALGVEADIDNQDFDVEQGDWRDMGGN